MKKSDRNLMIIVAIVGVLFLGAGIVPLATIGSPLPSTVIGGQVYDEAICSNGFGAGNCPIITFAWSGSLVSPNIAANILENVLHQTFSTSCGIDGLYSSNIPVVTGQGGKPDAEYQPYMINPAYNYEGYVVYNGVVYLEGGYYSTGDGCGAISGTATATSTATTTHNTIGFGFPGIGAPSLDLSLGTLAVVFVAVLGLYLVMKRGKGLGI